METGSPPEGMNIAEISINGKCCSEQGFWKGFAVAGFLFALVAVGFAIGKMQSTGSVAGASKLPPELLKASATHGTSTMAIATGPIDEDAEGIFFLDYITGDLQCWVYYPRTQAFGAKFVTNVRGQLSSGKNPEYLMVTGAAVARGTSSNARPALSLVYVMDVHEGTFATYTLPWNRALENAGQVQGGALVYVGGDHIRPPLPNPKK